MDNARLLKGVKLYSEKEFEGLSPEQREQHLENSIRKILLNAADGVTVSHIASLIPYASGKTIQRYLDKLINTNFGYKKLIGNTFIYYHNGRLMHEAIKENIPIGNKSYSFYYIKNPEGDYVFIQEKKRNELNAVTISGGVIVEKQQFAEFLEHLNDINNKLDQYNKEG
jgi:hypothetical protein